MLFNSYAFAIFLPIVFFIYWLFPAKNRWIVLLLSSCYFYMSWDVKYIFLLLFTATATYLCGIAIENAEQKKQKKIYMICLLVVCLGLLGFFKYAQFLFLSTISLIISSFNDGFANCSSNAKTLFLYLLYANS